MRKYTIEHAVNVERQEAKNEKVEKKNSKDGKTSNSTSKEKSAD